MAAWSADAGNTAVQAVSQGQAVGRCRVSRRAADAIRACTTMRVRPTVAVVALAKDEPVIVAAAQVRLNAIVASTSQAPLGREAIRGQVGQGRVFRIGMNLLDDDVVTVRRVGSDRVQRAGREERVEPPGVKQRGLRCSLVRVEVGDAADHQPPGHLLGGLLRAERGERDLGDLGLGRPRVGDLPGPTGQ